jgi:hypothetical protein
MSPSLARRFWTLASFFLIFYQHLGPSDAALSNAEVAACAAFVRNNPTDFFLANPEDCCTRLQFQGREGGILSCNEDQTHVIELYVQRSQKTTFHVL